MLANVLLVLHPNQTAQTDFSQWEDFSLKITVLPYDKVRAEACYMLQSFDLLILPICERTSETVIRLLQLIRRYSEIPIIVQAENAACKEAYKIKAFQAGSDLCIEADMPLTIKCTLAQALILKSVVNNKTEQNEYFHVNKETKIDLAVRKVYVRGEQIDLCRKEFDLFALLAKHNDRIITHEEIIEGVLGYDAHKDHSKLNVWNLISRLKKKLRMDIIATVRGIGYRLK